MVKVSTLFYLVDGFKDQNFLSTFPDILNQDRGDQFLETLLNQLVFDPGEALVKTIFEKI
jgi:hypothetical protein